MVKLVIVSPSQARRPARPIRAGTPTYQRVVENKGAAGVDQLTWRGGAFDPAAFRPDHVNIAFRDTER
jgi:hypothetical protein